MRKEHTASDACERVLPLLPRYSEGALSRRDAAGVRRHIATCASCREALHRQELLSKWIVGSAAPLPPELHGDVMRVVHAEPRSGAESFGESRGELRRKRLPARRLAVALAVGCFVLLAVAVLPITMTVGRKAFAPAPANPDMAMPGENTGNYEDSATYGDGARELTVYREHFPADSWGEPEQTETPGASADDKSTGRSAVEEFLTRQGVWCATDGSARLIFADDGASVLWCFSGGVEQAQVCRDGEDRLTLTFASGVSWTYTVRQNEDGTLTLCRILAVSGQTGTSGQGGRD